MKKQSGFTKLITGENSAPVGWFDMLNPAARQLSFKQAAVLNLLRDALPNKLIAAELGIGIEAVKDHLRELMRKTGCKSRIELALFADRNFYPPGLALELNKRLKG